jgi:tetratricopeptide (TPR) repeat protein
MAKKKQTPGVKNEQPKQDAKVSAESSTAAPDGARVSPLNFNRYQALFLALLILVAAIIYSNTLQAPFTFDDQNAISNNPFIRMEKINAKSLMDAAVGYGKTRPVAMLSFGLNYYFGQYDVIGYHLVNILIHIVNGVLLFFLVKLTLTLSNRQTRTTRKLNPITIITLSFFTALLWLANPVQTQSVTYIVQRMNSMGAMFYLLALFLYVKGRIAQQRCRREVDGRSRYYWGWFAGCALAGLLALGSKESTALLPVFIFLYEWYFFQDLDPKWFKGQLKYVLVIALLFGVVAGIYLGFDPTAKFNTLRDYVLKEFSIGQRLLTQARVVVYYLTLIFYPDPSRLNLDHDFPLSYSLIDPVSTLPAIIIIVGMVLLGWLSARRQRLLSFCIFWYLGNLVIESSVIPLALIFEHRMYLPSMLVFLLVVILFYRYISLSWLVTVLACVAVAVSSYWTYERNKIWQDDLALWRDCSQKSPNKARPYLNIGQILTERQQYDDALPNYLKALQINPDFVDAHYNLGVLFNKRGEPQKAIEHYRKAVELEPTFAKANNNLGVVLLKQDQTEEAINYFRKALKFDPKLAAAHINMGAALVKQNQFETAVVHFNEALKISSNLPNAQYQLASALLKMDRTEQAVKHLERAIQLNPDHAEARNDLGGQLLQQGETEKAFEQLSRAIDINPELAEAHNNLGIILIRRGDVAAAISHFEDALRIDPDFGLARKNLQKALALRGSGDSEWRRLRNEMESRPDDPNLYFQLGNLHLRRGELGQAISAYEKALALQPSFLAAQNNLAMAYAANRMYDRALPAFKKLVDLDPHNSGTYYNIAVLYALQGNVSESVAWLETAIERGYQNWELIKTDPDLDNIRDSAEYRQLVQGH